MFGPEGRPQHCCAWLGVASGFPECASPIVPEEVIDNMLELFSPLFLLTRNILIFIENNQIEAL